jgi:hypothetical protein
LHAGAVLADGMDSKAEIYRLRAKEVMAQSQSARDDISKRTLLELANSWLELARRAEDHESGNGPL